MDDGDEQEAGRREDYARDLVHEGSQVVVVYIDCVHKPRPQYVLLFVLTRT